MKLGCYFALLLAFYTATGCDLLSGTGEPPADVLVNRQLNQLQIALEQSVTGDEPTSVAVAAVVDSIAMHQAAEGEEEEDATRQQQALARERVVRQEVQNRLVKNTLIDVVQPGQEHMDNARGEITASNSAALSTVLAGEIGQALSVEHLVSVLIDEEGAEVNIVAQHVADGKLLFQETLMNWPVLVGEEEPEEGE